MNFYKSKYYTKLNTFFSKIPLGLAAVCPEQQPIQSKPPQLAQANSTAAHTKHLRVLLNAKSPLDGMQHNA